MSRHGFRGLFGALLLTIFCTAALAGAGSFPSSADAVVRTYAYDGFEACQAPSISHLQSWWTHSPYFFLGIYIGGEDRGCPNSNLTATWVSAVHNQGWAFLPTWVGRQDPCWGGSAAKFSTNTTTAYGQGKAAANSAASVAGSLGFGSGSVIYYDLEAYSQTSTCVNAADAFMHGWDQQLAVKGDLPGVYGSSSGSGLGNLHNLAYEPKDAWAADWNGTNNVWGLSGLPNADWVSDHRLHQYKGGHNETYGGVTINIDTDCSLGPEDMASGFAEGSLYDTGSTNESNGPSEDPSCH